MSWKNKCLGSSKAVLVCWFILWIFYKQNGKSSPIRYIVLLIYLLFKTVSAAVIISCDSTWNGRKMVNLIGQITHRAHIPVPESIYPPLYKPAVKWVHIGVVFGKRISISREYAAPVSIYLFKVSNRNTRKRCEICSKLTIKTPERGHWNLYS